MSRRWWVKAVTGSWDDVYDVPIKDVLNDIKGEKSMEVDGKELLDILYDGGPVPLPDGWEDSVTKCLLAFRKGSWRIDVRDALVFMAWMLNRVLEEAEREGG